MSSDRMPMRKEILDGAAEAVLHQRNKSYGEPDEDFQRIAELLNALGVRLNGNRLTGHNVSMIMIQLKMSRLTWSPTHKDSWLDIAGYAACGYETAMLQEARETMHSMCDVEKPCDTACETTPAPGWREKQDRDIAAIKRVADGPR